MVKLTIDETVMEVPTGTTILEAARSHGMNIPTLCYYKNLNDIGACRVCLVELKDKDKLVTACNTNVAEGMVVYTNTPAVREARQTNVELILSQHRVACTSCVRGGNCSLQTLSNQLGAQEPAYQEAWADNQWDMDFPLIRDNSKCIKCMRCIQVCDHIQSLHVWDVLYPGTQSTIGVHENKAICDSNCSLCGQCITHCPVGALSERDDVARMKKALADPDVTTIVQIAPAIRTAWGEAFGLTPQEATVQRLATILRHIGFDVVFDTTFSADLTIMEESSEFLKFMQHKQPNDLPMFTSCCPGWVRFAKSEYPELLDQLSTSKSPQQMFGAVTKTWYADKIGLTPKQIFSVSIMPCVAKKAEAELPSMTRDDGTPDVDLVLTTREITRMIKSEYLDPKNFAESRLDDPLGIGSGAGVIFGSTGGVMEAALRSAYYFVNGENADADTFKAVRGENGCREVTTQLGGKDVKAIVVNGLANTRQLIENLKAGKVHCDFVEVMACPGGCVGGGGQPIHDGEEMAARRAPTLYRLDKNDQLRFSHDNPSIKMVYQEYLGDPLSNTAEHLLHTHHVASER
ncbi:MAG: [FeFe] hydrogenase, group A [Lactobacillus sp.]|jgi:NADH-quinone oxidoreductase subunit G|nr:[FeFe] hydrogenase, group A [Lactobacillus sp.]